MPGASGVEAAAEPTARIVKATIAPKKVKVKKEEPKEDPEIVHARYEC